MLHKKVEEIKEFVGRTKVFTATFVKKDGTLRVMNCRLGVKKGVKGIGLSYDPFKKNLLPVYDMQKRSFRMINVSTIRSLKAHNQELTF